MNDLMNVAISRKRPGLLYALAVTLPSPRKPKRRWWSLPPAGVRQRADGGLQRQHLARGDENRPAVNHYRPVGVGGHPPADGGSGGEYHQPGAGIYPGVYSSFGGGATRFDAISLRGYHGGDVDNLFLDGMRLMSDGGSHNVLQIDPWFIERVDVIRGLLCALRAERAGRRGQPDFKRPQFSQQGHIRLTGGTQNTKDAAFDYTDAINDQWAWRLIGMTRSSDTQYDHTREERYAISPSLLAAGQRHLAAAARLSAKDPSGGYHGSLPLDGTRYAHNGRKLSPAPTKAIREMAISAASRSTAMSLTTSSPTSGRSIPPGATPIPTSPSIRSTRSAG